jgi:hypothetical protein
MVYYYYYYYYIHLTMQVEYRFIEWRKVNEKDIHQGAPFNSYIKFVCVYIYIYSHTFMHSY